MTSPGYTLLKHMNEVIRGIHYNIIWTISYNTRDIHYYSKYIITANELCIMTSHGYTLLQHYELYLITSLEVCIITSYELYLMTLRWSYHDTNHAILSTTRRQTNSTLPQTLRDPSTRFNTKERILCGSRMEVGSLGVREECIRPPDLIQHLITDAQLILCIREL